MTDDANGPFRASTTAQAAEAVQTGRYQSEMPVP